MTGSDRPTSADRLTELLDDGEGDAARACLDRLASGAVDTRKQVLRALRTVAEERPAVLDPVVPSLTPFLRDEERAVRLSAAKLFVELARSDPAVVLPAVDALADRLGDETEFYYVRARSAEALGYVALDHPERVDDPETLADLRVGLEFDEPEVTVKLAKALEYVALGNPHRLRHQVPSLAAHLDDEQELVRYHLCTALLAVGCENPETLSPAAGALRQRLDDESPYVRGRAAEALGVLAQSEVEVEPIPDLGDSDATDDSVPSFEADRVRYARRQFHGSGESGAAGDDFGTVESARASTSAAIDAITSPDDEGQCPHCGLELPDGGPPMCPRCGGPC